MKLDRDQVLRLIACPRCHGILVELAGGGGVVCGGCAEGFPEYGEYWDLIPARAREKVPQWDTWETLQANGLASYREDPEHNLGVGDRADHVAFGHFCRLGGVVLDVGCGPQEWPTHFSCAPESTVIVGVDPLVSAGSPRYTQLRSIGEFLPFPDVTFDRVLFVTSLDHFTDPAVALNEGRRVCRSTGEVVVWIGEKSPDAPRPAESPEWYRNLKRPENADDVFHYRRLGIDDLHGLAVRAGLRLSRDDVHEVDPYRRNYFAAFMRG